MSTKNLRLLSYVVLCAGIASVLLFFYEVTGSFDSKGILVLPLVPYLVAFIPALLSRNRFIAVGTLFGCVFLVGASAWIYYYAFFIDKGSYNGLYFLLVPMGQLAFCVMLLAWVGIAALASAPGRHTRAA